MSLLRASALRPLAPQAPLARCFSTTPQRRSVPPQSPSYIRLPKAPQNEERKIERVRGFLPVPRQIFARNEGRARLTKAYFDKTIPRARHRANSNHPEQTKWNQEVSDARRMALRNGLDVLWKRQHSKAAAQAARNKVKLEQNRIASEAPEREDDRLTRGSFSEGLLDFKVYSDPKRFETAEQRRKEIEAAEIAKKESRRDSLMELYINASNFITTEAELKKEIDKVFSEDYFKSQMAGQLGPENAWGIHGAPHSFVEMLASSKKTSTKLVYRKQTDYDWTVNRQKKIAEELTGGKMV